MWARQLKGDDATAWKDLRLQGLAAYPKAFLTTDDEAQATPLAQIASRLDSGHTFGVFSNTGMLGIASLIPQKRVQTRHRGEIGAFFVRQKEHGTGAANTLLEKVIAAAHDMGIWQLELYVALSNSRAIAFYERHGFAEIGRLPNAVLDGGAPETDVIMVRTRPSR